MKETIHLGFEIDGLNDSIDKIEETEEAVKSLKQQLAEAEDAAIDLAGAEFVDQEELKKAIQRAAELKAIVNETNAEIDRFASTSKFKKLSNSFGGVRESLMTLDFEEAAKRSESLVQAAGDISFDSATKSLKGLGKTFINLGKSLLANPLFLLATAVVGIVLVFKELMDQVGLTKVIMEQLGKVFEIIMIPIDAMIQQLKNLTDWLGWTNNAAEDLAEAQKVAMKAAADASAENTKNIVQDLDNQIRMQELLGNSTEELQRRRMKALEENAQAQAIAAETEYEAARIKGELTAEEIEDLRLKSEEQRRAYEQAVDDTAFFEAKINKEKSDTQAETLKLEEEARKQAKKAREEDAEKRLAEEKAEQSRLLAIKRRTEDLALELVEDSTEREIQANKYKYDRIIEDTLADETLKAEEKEKLVEFYRLLSNQKNEEIKAKQQAKIDAENANDLLKAAQNEATRTDLKISYMEEGLAKEKAIRENAFEAEKADLTQKLADGLITKAEFDSYALQAKANFESDVLALEAASAAESRAIEVAKTSAKIDLAMQSLTAIQGLVNAFAKEDERSAKKAFQLNKALSMGIAVAQTAQGIMAALASPKDVLTGQNYLKAGIVAATGAAQIATIAKSKFEVKTTPLSPPPVGVQAGSNYSSLSSTSAPTGLLPQSNPNQGFELYGGQGTGTRQNSLQRAFVVESDITGTQDRLASYSNRAEIG